MPAPPGLPALGAGERAHVERMHALIRAEVEARGGAISVLPIHGDCALRPRLGYYRAGWRTFGAQGDFVTAPEISPLFARTVARRSIRPSR